jgi:hypothetical protein
MFEFLLAFSLVVVVMGIVILIAGRDPKPNRKRTSGALSGALGAFNEFYQPSAREAAVIVEEQARARKQAGSEGKRKPRQN